MTDSVRKQLWELKLLLLMCPPRIQVAGSHGADREYLVAALNGAEQELRLPIGRRGERMVLGWRAG